MIEIRENEKGLAYLKLTTQNVGNLVLNKQSHNQVDTVDPYWLWFQLFDVYDY
jgi:hypothetical protein